MLTWNLFRVLVPIGGKVVKDDNGAWRDLWHQHLLDAGPEGAARHGPAARPEIRTTR
jgi:hypothetical protein